MEMQLSCEPESGRNQAKNPPRIQIPSREKVWSSGIWILDSGLWLLHSGLTTLDSKFWILDSETLDLGFRIFSKCETWSLEVALTGAIKFRDVSSVCTRPCRVQRNKKIRNSCEQFSDILAQLLTPRTDGFSGLISPHRNFKNFEVKSFVVVPKNKIYDKFLMDFGNFWKFLKIYDKFLMDFGFWTPKKPKSIKNLS